MLQQEMLTRIAQHFELIIRTQYHTQIEVSERKYHDIWLPKFGGLLVKLYGNQQTRHFYNVERAIEELKKYDYSKSDLSAIDDLKRIVNKAGKRNGIFVDAGFKDGTAKIVVIRKNDEDVDLHIRKAFVDNSHAAECLAIKLALLLYPSQSDGAIFSDCLTAVEEINKSFETNRAVWIERSKNKSADKLANLRK